MSTSAQMNVVRIRGGHGNYEHATICWQGWQATGNDGKPRECGEILIHSSFGSWANSWGHMGVPMDSFLAKVERGYCAEKFMGSNAYRFDGELSVKGLRERVLEWRRDGTFEKDEARAVWDWISENDDRLESSPDLFVETMYDGQRYCELKRPAEHFFEEPWERIRTSLDHQFACFWRDLWPVFVKHLKQGGV